MRVTYEARPLGTDASWAQLARAIGGGHPPVVDSTVRHLRLLGIKSYILEEPYIDRDYSADYFHSYSRTFRTYPRHCKRAHFFTEDVTHLFARPRSTDQLQRLRRTTTSSSYCGFCVIRPLSQAPIGRSVLAATMHQWPEMESTVTCRANFGANLAGVDFTVTGAAYLQQDSRVGACAQVSIWAGLRHLHARYGYDWVSVADITRLATPTAFPEATSLPAGSEFLTSERMLRAISEAGFQPLCFGGPNVAAAVLPYVDSGIPVILGLRFGTEVGHAVTVIGRVFTRRNSPTNNAIDYISAYIVHDDQGGPYMLLPTGGASEMQHPFGDHTIKRMVQGANTELNASHATFAIALMSPRVFLTAAKASVSARDRFDSVLPVSTDFQQGLAEHGISADNELLDELRRAHAAGGTIMRTYLTSAAGYRRYIAGSSACDDLKDALLALHLPHFTWITEISTVNSFNHYSAGERRIYGHAIVDATSTGRDGDGVLALHLPGTLYAKDVDERGFERESLEIIEGDRLYDCRIKNH